MSEPDESRRSDSAGSSDSGRPTGDDVAAEQRSAAEADERRADEVADRESEQAATDPTDDAAGPAGGGAGAGSGTSSSLVGHGVADDAEIAGAGTGGPGSGPRRTGMFGVRGSGDTSGFGGLQVGETNPIRLGSTPASSTEWTTGLRTLAEAAEHGLRAAGVVLDEAIEKVVADRGELTIFVRRAHLLRVAQVFRDDAGLRYEVCLGVSGVHDPAEAGRELHAVYPLLSMTHNRRIRLETTCPDADPHLPSTVQVWPANNWHERETYDFFGIIFDGHPALTRIEMPDDWPGHPQRKDYPLGGIPVEYKGATIPPPDTRRSYS